MQTEQEAREVKRRHSAQLRGRPGVCGVGVEKDETGRYVIAIHLAANDPSATRGLPSEIEGYSVKLVHSGPFQKVQA